MATVNENTQAEQPADLYVEKDILGLDKKPVYTSPTKASPNKIFIILAIIIIAAVAYGFFSGR